MNPLKNKRVLLGVTGSIACYKALDLASKLTQSGALVNTIMTKSSMEFINPISFKSISNRTVITDLFDNKSNISINHIAMAEWAEVIIIAPATANTISKLANGASDDALGTTLLATKAPIIIAPAMDGNMWENPATQYNIVKLMERGILIEGPQFGRMASGQVGSGRMTEPSELTQVISMVLGKNGDLQGKKIVVTAGGTHEPIDPVRSITNKSSGKMGFAIAEAARDRGASVTLISAPSHLQDPIGITQKKISSAMDMKNILLPETSNADALIMAAAVGDWRSKTISTSKEKKHNDNIWTIDLVRNSDLISEITNPNIIKIGFAAETENLVKNSKKKIIDKKLDLIIGNDVSRKDIGFNSEQNEVVIINQSGEIENLPLMSKYDLSHEILDRVQSLLR
jgi:phosphopantothenoylcysteine decarboxylase/phosphopantothenate--cysteine ligase